MRYNNYFVWSCVGLEEHAFPDIYCPNCNNVLTYRYGSLTKEETSKSQPDSKDYIITCKYYCEYCNEPVVMVGYGYSENRHTIYPDPNFNKDVILYTPQLFVPTIHLFNIPSKCPLKVRNQIIKSFSLFWHDIDSCVSKLRMSLELLMDSQRINKTATLSNIKKTRHRLTLHKRIELFKEKNQKVGELLEAIKWIGNKGSHANKKLIVNEAIEAYIMLEHALNELYEPKIDILYNLAKKINKRKGCLPRRPKRR